MDAACSSQTCRAGRTNEDSIITLKLTGYADGKRIDLSLIGVADGVGGEPGGETASRLAISSVARTVVGAFLASPSLSVDKLAGGASAIIGDASREIYAITCAEPLYSGMSSTLTYALIKGNECSIGHVGDSRCYQIKGTSIIRLTPDHNLNGELTQYLGSKNAPTCTSMTLKIDDGDWILACCDGLTSFVSDEQILSIVLCSATSTEACSRLTEAAKTAGSDDDVSIALVRVGRGQISEAIPSAPFVGGSESNQLRISEGATQ